MPAPTMDAPEIPILLLGDAGVGKSTFLSRFALGPPSAATASQKLPSLRDLDQPFPFNVRLYNRPYRFEFYDTASPENYTLLKPAVIILCYSIADPQSLTNVHTHWKEIVEMHFNYDESLPVILLGLMRDVRQQEDYDGRVKKMVQSDDDEVDSAVLNGRNFVYPQEALRIAQEMRCDVYCECSALTGELCEQVFEDISRTAARTTTSNGAKTRGMECAVM